MKSIFAIACALMITIIVSNGDAVAQEFKVDDNCNELYLWPSYSFMYAAPVAYYKVFGIWPETWSTIVEAGLCQVELSDGDGKLIDPDDGEWDFMGDLAYQYQGAQVKPLILMCTDSDGLTIDSAQVGDPGMTYEHWLSEYSNDPEGWSYLNDRDDVLIMIALRKMLLHSIGDYKLVNGDVPESWDTLIESGISMLDADSVNPMTGGEFYGDGRPSDFSYQYLGENFCDLQVTDENGETTWRRILDF